MPIISSARKLSIVEVWQHGKVIFKGNSLDVRKHFGITQQQFNRIRTTGIAVSRGSTPRPETLYAIKIGEETKVVEMNYKTDLSREEIDRKQSVGNTKQKKNVDCAEKYNEIWQEKG